MESSEATGTAPILNVTGERIALGPLRRDLLPLYQRWVNDFATTRTLAIGSRPVTWEAEVRWYEAAATSERAVTFTIYERATLRPIGSAGLDDIDHQHRTAAFGILIGERDCW